MTVAAGIDCGTNSIRLLVAEVAADGSLTDLTREMQIVRLGQGVDATGRLAPEAIERTRVALVGLPRHHRPARGARRCGWSRPAPRATRRTAPSSSTWSARPSAPSRRSSAGSRRRRCRSAVAWPGSAPARAVRRSTPRDTDLLVVDLGGGSTEVVRGRVGAPDDVRAHSMDVGCVRMTERHLVSDPPTPEQIAAVEADVDGRARPGRAPTSTSPVPRPWSAWPEP